jgi:hypothetical protein
LKKVIICVLLVVLVATVTGSGIALNNTRQDLKVTENALLDEANFSQKQREALRELREEKDELERKLAQQTFLAEENAKALEMATIAGRAFIDQYPFDKLGFNDKPAQDLRVQLVEVAQEKGAAYKVVAVTTADKFGRYSFRVEAGSYLVQPLLSVPGYPAWSYSANLEYRTIEVSKGELALGPIFLVR